MKTNTVTSTITHTQEFPVVNSFQDYHDIDVLRDDFMKMGFKGVKAKEIDFDGKYWAVFYQNTIPTPKELVSELKKLEFCSSSPKTKYKK